MRWLGQAACNLGIGLVAGLVGTAAITVSQMVEMRARNRKPSPGPVKAVEKVFGLRPLDSQSADLANHLVHWGYGTAWGTFRSLLDLVGVDGPIATGLHAVAIEGAAIVMLPGLKLAPPASEWGASEIALESLHHLVYATAAGLTYDWLSGSLEEKPESGLPWNLLGSGLAIAAARRLGELATQPRALETATKLATDVTHGDWQHARKLVGLAR